MAIDSKTIYEASRPIGIPGRYGGATTEIYGSSPPVRLPSFTASPNSAQPNRTVASMTTIQPSFSPASNISIRRRRNVLDHNAIRDLDLEGQRPSSDDFIPDYDPVQSLSTSFFSSVSIEDFMTGGVEERLEYNSINEPRVQCRSPGEDSFSRISKQGRKLLRSSRLPIEHILEFEELVFDHLRTKTPRHRFLADDRHYFVVTIQNPFRRSLLHSVCQYYRLTSQTMDKQAGITMIKATQQTNMLPDIRLSDYLVATFGHELPSP